MITLERLVELREDKALMDRLLKLMWHAVGLVAVDPNRVNRTMTSGSAPSNAINAAMADAKVAAEATSLVIYEETRRPFIELLRDIYYAGAVPKKSELGRRLGQMLTDHSDERKTARQIAKDTIDREGAP